MSESPGAGGGGHGLDPGERGAHRRGDPGDLVLRLQQRAAVLPDLPAQVLHDLRGRRDGIAAEKLAAGKERRRAAHFVAVGQSSLRPPWRRRGTQPPVSGERILLRILQSGGKGPLVALQDGLAFPREFLADALGMLLRASPNHPASRPSTTLFLACSVPAAFMRHVFHRHGQDHGRESRPPRGIMAGSTPVLVS